MRSSRYILSSSVAHTSIAIGIAVAIKRYVHTNYVLRVVGAIGVKVTAFLKTYVNVSYRARSRRRRIRAPAAVYRWLTVEVSPVFSHPIASRIAFSPFASLFLSILYHRSFCMRNVSRGMLVARETSDWPRITSGDIRRDRVPAKAHAVVLTSGSVITRDYATPKRRPLRSRRVYGTTVRRNYCVFSELVALPTAFRESSLCKLRTCYIMLVLTRAVSLEKINVEATTETHGEHLSNFIKFHEICVCVCVCARARARARTHTHAHTRTCII